MTKLLNFIGDLFEMIVNAVELTITMLIAFIQSLIKVVTFALDTGPSTYLPGFVLPAFVLLVVYAVIKIIINRE